MILSKLWFYPVAFLRMACGIRRPYEPIPTAIHLPHEENSMKKSRLGLTLIELVVVMAILGALAAMLLPKFDGLQSAANHVAAGSSMTDVAKLVQTYKTSKTVYPDGWDSLTSGSSLWTAGNVGTQTKGLHSQLVDSSNGKLTMGTALTATQVSALNAAGITTLYTLTAGSTNRAGDMFTTATPIAAGTTLAIINPTTNAGKNIIDRIYRKNQVAGTGVSGAIASTTANPAGDANAQLIVFGLGPQSALIPNSMMEAPTYSSANASYIYNRLLVVFELTASKVTFKTVLGADGDLPDDLSVNMQTGTL